jgi:glycosyltransferase involved in cell wall biosynthesis
MVRTKKTIVYAGNFGEGQGLHKIIPQAAKLLGANFNFLIIGDGGAKKALKKEIDRLNVKNITIQNPINRSELMKVYQNADFLFLHLNDYPAFRKVLPSKIFELATFNKPIIAGVSGFAKEFIESEVSDSFVFDPCNVNQLVAYLKINVPSRIIDRDEFISKYRRSNINKAMAESILSYI